MSRPRDVLSAGICWTCAWYLRCICSLRLTAQRGQSHLTKICMVGLYGVPHSVVVHGVPAMPEAGEKHVLHGIDLMIFRCIQQNSKKQYHTLQQSPTKYYIDMDNSCFARWTHHVEWFFHRRNQHGSRKKNMEAAPARKRHAPQRRRGIFLGWQTNPIMRSDKSMSILNIYIYNNNNNNSNNNNNNNNNIYIYMYISSQLQHSARATLCASTHFRHAVGF